MAPTFYNCFATPVLVVPELITESTVKQRITQIVRDEFEHSFSKSRSNRFGWESDLGFERHDDPAVKKLKNAVHNLVVNLTVHELKVQPSEIEIIIRDSALANVGTRGAYHVPHIHRNSSWSTVYYVDVPADDPEPGGELELLDPRMNALIPGIHERKQSFRIKPTTGMAVCFPSWLEHWVHPWNSDKPRLSVAWNSRILEVRKRQNHTSVGGSRSGSEAVDNSF